METKIPSGAAIIDVLLDGGYEKDSVTCIYGPPGAGKTNLTLLCIVNSVLASKKKVVYVDTEGNFSIARFKQICPDAYEEALQHIIFLKPMDFQEQSKAIAKLHTIADEKKIGLIVLDSAAMLYRLEFAKGRDSLDINRELSLQLSHLTEIARRKNIPIILTNQVYTDLDDGTTKMVGGDMLRYAAKCLIEIKKLAGGNRAAILRKHRSLPEDKSVTFRIVERGIEEIELSSDSKERDDIPAEALFTKAYDLGEK